MVGSFVDLFGVILCSICLYVVVLNVCVFGVVVVEFGLVGYCVGLVVCGVLWMCFFGDLVFWDWLYVFVWFFLDESVGIDVFDMVEELYVSEVMFEVDFVCVCGFLDGIDLVFECDRENVCLCGNEVV